MKQYVVVSPSDETVSLMASRPVEAVRKAAIELSCPVPTWPGPSTNTSARWRVRFAKWEPLPEWLFA